MSKVFDPDSKLMNLGAQLANMMILSVVYLICCIPVITIGAATTALYSVQIRLLRGETDAIIKSFWKGFLEDFRKSTLLLLIVVPILAVLALDVFLITELAPDFPKAAKIALGVLGVILLMGLEYVFPLTAQFQNTIGATLKNALIFSVLYPVHSVGALLITVFPFLIMYAFDMGILQFSMYWFVLGPGIQSNLKMNVMKKVFRRYMPAERDNETDLPIS